MKVSVEREIGGRKFSLTTGEIGKQASGCILIQYAETVALVAAQVGVAVVAYLVTPFDLAWQLGTSADRVIFQAVPLALLLGTLYLGLLLDRAPFAPGKH